MSIIFLGGIILYFAVLISRSKSNKPAKVYSVVEKTDISLNPSRTLTLNQSNFDIALGFTYAGTNPNINSTNIDNYFSFVISQINYAMITDPAIQVAVGSTYYWNKTKTPMVVCDASRFNGMTTVAANLGITGSYLCPVSNFSFNLQGGYTTPTAQILEVEIDYCLQETLDFKFPGQGRKCVSQNISNSILSQIQIYIPQIVQSFNTDPSTLNANQNPVTQKINNDIYLTLVPNVSNNYYYKISQNDVNIESSWFSNMFSPTTYLYQDMRFYLLEPGQYNPSMNLPLITVEYLIDENMSHFYVERQGLQDICALTGGLAFFVYIVIKAYTRNWFEQDFFRKIAQRIFLFDDSQEGEQGNKISQEDADTKRDQTNLKRFKAVTASTLYYLTVRWRKRLVCRFCCRPKHGKALIIDKAQEKVSQQLDIVQIIKQLRKVDLLSKIVLSYPQRLIASAAKHNIISSSPIEESVPDEDFEWIKAASDADALKVVQEACSGDVNRRFAAQFSSQFDPSIQDGDKVLVNAEWYHP